jgi:hypothetical protein
LKFVGIKNQSDLNLLKRKKILKKEQFILFIALFYSIFEFIAKIASVLNVYMFFVLIDKDLSPRSF